MVCIKGPYRKRHSARAVNMEPTDYYPYLPKGAQPSPAPVNTRLRSDTVVLYIGRSPFAYRTHYMGGYRMSEPYSNYRHVITPSLIILDDDVEGYRTPHTLRRRTCFWISSNTTSMTNNDYALLDNTWTLATPFKVVNFKKEMRQRRARAFFKRYHDRIRAWKNNSSQGIDTVFGVNLHKSCKKAHMRRLHKVST